MGGLLYNSFVSVKGKRIAWVFGILTILFIVVRVIFPGWRTSTYYYEVNYSLTMGSDVDLVMSVFPMIIIIVGLGSFVNMWNSRCIEADEKNKIRAYLSAMPIGKNAYVASKYVFIGIATYVFFSLSMVWTISAGAFSVDSYALNLLSFTYAMQIAMLSFSVFVSALELFLFLVLGKKKAMMIKVGFLLLLGIAVVGFILFGDLHILEKIDLEKIVHWMNTHQFEVVLMQILTPVVSLLIYFGSYKLTCALYGRKERDYD